jgi:hypothetical protein
VVEFGVGLLTLTPARRLAVLGGQAGLNPVAPLAQAAG